jgi:hypothetical protein
VIHKRAGLVLHAQLGLEREEQLRHVRVSPCVYPATANKQRDGTCSRGLATLSAASARTSFPPSAPRTASTTRRASAPNVFGTFGSVRAPAAGLPTSSANTERSGPCRAFHAALLRERRFAFAAPWPAAGASAGRRRMRRARRTCEANGSARSDAVDGRSSCEGTAVRYADA